MSKLHKKVNKPANILFISPCLPYPLDDGIKIRAFHTMKELKNKGHKITLACFIREDDDINVVNLKNELNIELKFIKLDQTVINVFSHIYYSLFSRYPFHMTFLYNKDFKKMLKSIMYNNSFDLVYIYDRGMVLYANDISGESKILDSVDSQSLNSLSGFKSSNNVIHKIFWYIDYIKSKRIEKFLYEEFKYVITAAKRDAEQLSKTTNSEVVNIPNGVDISYFKPVNLDKIPYSLTFLGTMDAFSNQQAVLYFIDEIFPSLKQNIPSIRFYVVGRDPPPEILKLHDNVNIFVTGYVEDIRSFIGRSEIIISPLKMASGIQNKILVPMAMNKPIVSTKESIGEINEVINDNDIIITTNTDEFAQKIVDLFSNKISLKEIGVNGRNIVKKNYSWESLGNKINAIINSMTN